MFCRFIFAFRYALRHAAFMPCATRHAFRQRHAAAIDAMMRYFRRCRRCLYLFYFSVISSHLFKMLPPFSLIDRRPSAQFVMFAAMPMPPRCRFAYAPLMRHFASQMSLIDTAC